MAMLNPLRIKPGFAMHFEKPFNAKHVAASGTQAGFRNRNILYDCDRAIYKQRNVENLMGTVALAVAVTRRLMGGKPPISTAWGGTRRS
jgi:hypothetical protein